MANGRRHFEEVVVPHLDAAFNDARWLAGSDADAEDVVKSMAMPQMPLPQTRLLQISYRAPSRPLRNHDGAAQA